MIEQYKPKTSRICRYEPSGFKERLRNGRYRQKMVLNEYYQIQDGRFLELHEWQKEAYKAVEEDGLTNLYTAIKHYVEKLPWLKKNEVDIYAMECLVLQAYLHWADFEYPDM